MANHQDRAAAVARVYSDAMLQLAEDQGASESLGDELAGLAALVESQPDFAAFLASPLVEQKDRAQALETMFRGRGSDLLVDSLQVLNRKGRLGLLASVSHQFRRSLNRLRQRVDVQVTSAVPLSDGQRQQLREQVTRRFGLEARLEEAVDASLLGGLVARIGDRKVDASVATRLRRLGSNLEDRTGRELHRAAAYVES